MALQPLVITCPLGRVNCSLQPLMAEEPVLVMVISSVRPVFQAFTPALTLQPPDGPGGGVVGGGVVGGVVGGGVVGGVLEVSPMNSRTLADIPVA